MAVVLPAMLVVLVATWVLVVFRPDVNKLIDAVFAYILLFAAVRPPAKDEIEDVLFAILVALVATFILVANRLEFVAEIAAVLLVILLVLAAT